MSESRFDSRPGTRSNEVVFAGKSPPKMYKLMFLAFAAAVVAGAFAGSFEFRSWLRVERRAAPWAASLSGGAATILLVSVVWVWNSRIRWVAVSEEGLRWRRGPRAKFRRWEQFVGIERGSVETTVWGEDLKTGRYARIQFLNGGSLNVSTETVEGFEELIAEIQLMAAQKVRSMFSISGSRHGSKPDSITYGPLRIGDIGLEWERTRYRWDEIADYEVSVGLLRIQATNGDEFLRRLTDLGDWSSALIYLDSRLGPSKSRCGGSQRAGGAIPLATAVE